MAQETAPELSRRMHFHNDGPPRRILIGSATLRAGNGGIARVGRLTARVLIESGADLTLLSYGDTKPFDLGGVEVRVARGNKLLFLAHCYRAAFSAARCIYDFAGIGRAHPATPFYRRPYSVWMHGIEAWEDMRPATHRVLRGAQCVLSNSCFTLSRFEALHGPLPQARVCWLATEEDDVPNEPPAFPDPPTALILARMWKDEGRKGHAELIDCWPQVVRLVPDARLLVVGGGSGCRDLQGLAARSPAARHIEFHGFVPEDAMDAVWRRARVLAMPSRQEGFGLVYIEAMRRGVPVIASCHDAGQEVNIDGVTGFNVDLDQPGVLAGRLAELLGNRSACLAMGENGRHRWRQHFRYSVFRDRLLAHLSAFQVT